MERANRRKPYRCKPNMDLDIVPWNVKQETQLKSLGKVKKEKSNMTAPMLNGKNIDQDQDEREVE